MGPCPSIEFELVEGLSSSAGIGMDRAEKDNYKNNDL